MVLIYGIEYPISTAILIYIQLVFTQFWYISFPALVGSIPIILIRTFAFPLLTRNPTELILIFGPNRARVMKVRQRVHPFFSYRNNLYWFDDPIEVGHNLYHIYIEGVNQPLTRLTRNQEKEANIMSLREYDKPLGHNIMIPPSFDSFIRNWVLIIKPEGGELKPASEVKEVRGKLRYKIGLLKRIGLFIVEPKVQEVEGANASGNAETVLTMVTMQMIQQKLGPVTKGTNFSSRYAFKILKRTRYVEINFIKMLTGAFDFRIILIILIIVAAMAGIYFLMPSGDIGPPPPGVTLK